MQRIDGRPFFCKLEPTKHHFFANCDSKTTCYSFLASSPPNTLHPTVFPAPENPLESWGCRELLCILSFVSYNLTHLQFCTNYHFKILRGLECWREHNCLGVKWGEGRQPWRRIIGGKNKREGNKARRGRDLQRYSVQKEWLDCVCTVASRTSGYLLYPITVRGSGPYFLWYVDR